MIIDFGAIKTLVGAWIDSHWDHTAILWKNDPDGAVAAIVEANQRYGKPVYFMDNPPTAEHIAEELARIAQELLSACGITVLRVDIAETPNCSATWLSHGIMPLQE